MDGLSNNSPICTILQTLGPFPMVWPSDLANSQNSNSLSRVAPSGIKNIGNILFHTYPKYKAQSYISLPTLKPQYKVSSRHPLSALEFKISLVMTKAHICFTFQLLIFGQPQNKDQLLPPSALIRGSNHVSCWSEQEVSPWLHPNHNNS